MPEILIRKMHSSDREAVAKLSEQGFDSLYQFDWAANAEALWVGCESGKVSVAVAEIAGEVVGYCNLRGWPAGGWIDQIAVSQRHRRSGVGRALLGHILKVAVERGFWKVSLIVSESDEGVQSFYTKYGFEMVGKMRDEIKKGLGGILLSYITDYRLHPNR